MEKINEVFAVGDDTLIIIEGNGQNINNGEYLIDVKGVKHEILSVTMVHHKNPGDIMKSTTLLVEGKWNND